MAVGKHLWAGLGLLAVTGKADAARPYLGLEAGMSTGDFGTTATSTLYSAVLSAGVTGEDWDAGASLPFYVLDSEGADTETGLGDLYLRAGRRLLPPTDGGTSVYGSAALKVPTADEDAGLGTGEPDAGGFLSLRQSLGRWQVSLFGGYTFLGDPPGEDLDNVVSYGAELYRRLDGAGLFAGVEGRTAAVPGADDPLELYGGGFRLLPGGRAWTVEGLVGLSDGSPDFGIRTGIVQWF